MKNKITNNYMSPELTNIIIKNLHTTNLDLLKTNIFSIGIILA